MNWELEIDLALLPLPNLLSSNSQLFVIFAPAFFSSGCLGSGVKLL